MNKLNSQRDHNLEVVEPWPDCSQQGPGVLHHQGTQYTWYVLPGRRPQGSFGSSHCTVRSDQTLGRSTEQTLEPPVPALVLPSDLRGGRQLVLGLVPALSPGLTTQSLSKQNTHSESSPVHPVPGHGGEE